MPSTPEPSLEAPADPLPAPAASGDGAEAEPEEGSEPAEVTESIPAPEDFVRVADWIPDYTQTCATPPTTTSPDRPSMIFQTPTCGTVRCRSWRRCRKPLRKAAVPC